MSLMIIGHIGLTVIVISAVTLSRAIALWQLFAGASLICLVYIISTNRFLLTNLDKGIENQLIKKLRLSKKPVEEILHLSDEYSIAEVELSENCPIINRSLTSLQLTKKDILVLAIKGENRLILTPTGNDIIKQGESLVVYGKLKNIEEIINCNI
ncbi:TrkA C-terminal domain-containing protein [Alkalicella caledoniensis]|uniref:TrkA C-terminal domain-containing protein n=1 Tax=Alkalicella caledoniensis TaxID=2731377 RepID=A0A7G9WAE0_ALKCA|nr:TrkA C-terminal domain-containing protein [Alkalicella caledoniensis]QNO15652.1 TrkA C-terminal domain-containing protein [Alkalicella caledoniensis]